MLLTCTICNERYPKGGRGTLDVCGECFSANLAGNILEVPTARHVLEAYVSAHQMTPREVQAMAWMTEIWRRQMEED